MSHSINSNCINCGLCENDCPVDAISEADKQRVIDATVCIDCGNCVYACPVKAIDRDD